MVGVGQPRGKVRGHLQSLPRISSAPKSLMFPPESSPRSDRHRLRGGADRNLPAAVRVRRAEPGTAQASSLPCERPSTAAWTARQMVEALPEETRFRYLIRDRDGIYGAEFRRRVAGLSLREVPHCPSVALVERLRGALRRIAPSRMLGSHDRPKRASGLPDPLRLHVLLQRLFILPHLAMSLIYRRAAADRLVPQGCADVREPSRRAQRRRLPPGYCDGKSTGRQPKDDRRPSRRVRRQDGAYAC